MSDDDEDQVRELLSGELGRCTGDDTFTVAEFAGDTATVFEVYRDEHGTPAAVRWEYACDEVGALRVGQPDRWSEAMADPELFYRRVSPRFIVRTPHQLPDGLRDLLPGPGRQVRSYTCPTSLKELLRAAVREDPIPLGYELAVLMRVPAGRTGAGRLFLTGLPLFRPGETQGRQESIRVRCEPTDDEGTAFVVVTREPRPDLPRHAQRLRPLQAQAAIVPPGTYDLTAVLTRPGRVRFDGLPARLADCDRSWDDLKRLVPDQLSAQVSAHLVCLIELCDGDERLQERVYRMEELIKSAQAEGAALRVSVVAYGAHGVAWKVRDRPPEIRAWAVSGNQAIKALGGLVGRTPDKREYQGAAQLECALRLVRERLATTNAGRPAIVTAGGRAAHPPGLDTRRQIIPCPDWVDGRLELSRLRALPGITFGAIRDPGCEGRLWDQLGEHAVASADDAVDMESFAADLGLRMAAQTVPFPVFEQ
jgi:hypothetical protein